MTYVPATMASLSAFLRGQGVPILGIRGDEEHTGGYHLGRDRIYTIPPGRGDDDYSVQTSRDKAGLTNAAAAIDIGKFDGRLDDLLRFLIGQSRVGAPDTKDIREVIAESYSGRVLWRWDDRTNRLSGTADLSTLHHGHISFYRDSEKRGKTAIFERFFLPDTSTGDEMVYSVPGIVSRRAPKGTPYYETATASAQKGVTGGSARYLLVGQDKEGATPTRYLVDGVAGAALMSWLPASALTDPQDESYNAGVTAAAKAAAEVKRS